MAYWKIFTFNRIPDLVDYLNGVLVGTVNLDEGATVDGLTIIIDIGSGPVTCTFSPAKSRDWTLQEIVDKINGTAGLAGTASISIKNVGHTSHTKDRRLQIDYEPAATISSSGTANTVLGFSAVSDSLQLVTSSGMVRNFIEKDGVYTILVYV